LFRINESGRKSCVRIYLILHEGCNSQISEKEKSCTITTHTRALFFVHSQSGQKNYKTTHMINDLGVTNDNDIMNIVVKVRKKKVGSMKY
jgi:hypothetical protein